MPAVAEGNTERGAKLAYTCLGCHGIEGYLGWSHAAFADVNASLLRSFGLEVK